ncbi:ABC transporter ATP-binding protein [Marinivivus vitaminiproducens]|uniref:ABC transporter ATP-binding protein n=1 Tax=Marinivivus vitaminiproducens TaxID=3035935 RepID=UPI0027AA907B|nr:ABC transporter ATP-binding protein [Geminicoccaceae bacterium SCSIO 64248]
MLLTVEGLAKSFGGVRALRQVSFSVASGDLVALIGPNGAGKTTCFNVIGGQLRPDAGKVRLGGRDVTGFGPRALFHQGVGRTFQITGTFASMTVIENVQLALISAAGRALHFWSRARRQRGEAATHLLAQVGLVDMADRPAGVLAYGDLKRLELAIALAHGPRLLLMDEPTAGMAGPERRALMDLTSRLVRAQGMGVLFVEHDLDTVFGHADRILVMHRGSLIASGLPDAIKADPEVRAVYLGEEDEPRA